MLAIRQLVHRPGPQCTVYLSGAEDSACFGHGVPLLQSEDNGITRAYDRHNKQKQCLEQGENTAEKCIRSRMDRRATGDGVIAEG